MTELNGISKSQKQYMNVKQVLPAILASLYFLVACSTSDKELQQQEVVEVPPVETVEVKIVDWDSEEAPRVAVQDWRKRIEIIRWEEINEITFNPFSGYLKIRGINKRITVHQHLVGLKEFTNKMEEKTKWNASELKLPIK